MKIPKRGEIWIVNLDPTTGSEIKKTRPAVIVSNDVNNKHSDTVTVIPVTSSTPKIYPFEVALPAGEAGLKHDSKAKANQIRTIDKRRLVHLIGSISESKISELEHAIAVHLDMSGIME
jgi:mRNA interferase MazF